MKAGLSTLIPLLLTFTLSCNPRVSPLLSTQNENVYVSKSNPNADSALLSFIKPYRDSLKLTMGRKVLVLPQKITHSRNNPQTLLGPWLCDILLSEGQVLFQNYAIDGAVYNPGGIRLPQLQDTVTVRDIYELLPFDNTLVLLEIPGHLLQRWIEHTVKRGGWPMSHTFKVYISSETQAQVYLHEQPIEPEKTYRILTNDYVANGGDNCEFLVGKEVASGQAYIRDIVINHFDKGNPPSIPQEIRIHFMTQNKN